MTKLEHLKIIDSALLDAWACAAKFWDEYTYEGNRAMSHIEDAKHAILAMQSQVKNGN